MRDISGRLSGWFIPLAFIGNRFDISDADDFVRERSTSRLGVVAPRWRRIARFETMAAIPPAVRPRQGRTRGGKK